MEKEKPDDLTDHWRETAELLGLPPEPNPVKTDKEMSPFEEPQSEAAPDESSEVEEEVQKDTSPASVLVESQSDFESDDDWNDDALSFSTRQATEDVIGGPLWGDAVDEDFEPVTPSAESDDEELLPDIEKEDTIDKEESQGDIEKPVKKKGRKRGRGKKGVKKKSAADDDDVADEDTTVDETPEGPRKNKRGKKGKKAKETTDDEDDAIEDWGAPSWDDLIASLYRPDK